MRISQFMCSLGNGWSPALPNLDTGAQLLFCFGSESLFSSEKLKNSFSNAFPNAKMIGCTTAGEIFNTEVSEEKLILTAVEFINTQISIVHQKISEENNSYDVGVALAKKLETKGLKHVFVISDGLKVNGTALVQGMSSTLGQTIKITGGLAGDGSRFEETQVWHNEQHGNLMVAALGLYGERLKVGFGSFGGWDPFGPERTVTQSVENVLYELDDQPALTLYKRYLGPHADDLPGSALLFPLAIIEPHKKVPMVRTVLSVNEDEGTMTFAGDIPQGAIARLMKANVDGLIDGAQKAAELTNNSQPKLALCVSCVGRKMLMHQRVEEEIEAIKEVLGEDCKLAGFYSYGEICPNGFEQEILLHNQTMTITTFKEE